MESTLDASVVLSKLSTTKHRETPPFHHASQHVLTKALHMQCCTMVFTVIADVCHLIQINCILMTFVEVHVRATWKHFAVGE